MIDCIDAHGMFRVISDVWHEGMQLQRRLVVPSAPAGLKFLVVLEPVLIRTLYLCHLPLETLHELLSTKVTNHRT